MMIINKERRHFIININRINKYKKLFKVQIIVNLKSIVNVIDPHYVNKYKLLVKELEKLIIVTLREGT